MRATCVYITTFCISACSKPAASTALPSDAAPVPSPTAVDAGPPVPTGTVREALDRVGDCTTKLGPATGGRAWFRTGGLIERTILRADAAASLSLSAVFPSGPEGPVTVTGGYASMTARSGAIDAELLVPLDAKATVGAPLLSFKHQAVDVAALPMGAVADYALVPTPGWLQTTLDEAIDARHVLRPEQLAMRQECIVLPPSHPGMPGRGQDCRMVPTTAADRKQMEDDARRAATAEHAFVKANLTVLSDLTKSLYPFADKGCAVKLVTGAVP